MPKLNQVRTDKRLRKDPHSGVYYVYLGKNEFKSLKTKKLKDAQERADLLLKSFHSDEWNDPTRTTLEQELSELMSLKQSEVSKSTFERWEGIERIYLRPFIQRYRVSPKQFHENTWQKYVRVVHQIKPGLTLDNHRKLWTMLARQLFHKGAIRRLPVFKNVDPESEAGRAFTDQEVSAIIYNADEELILQILLATHTPRLREILHVKWDQFDLNEGILQLRDIKTGKPKFVPIGDEALEILKTRRSRIDSEFVFPSPKGKDRPVNDNRHAWRTACDRAGIPYEPYKCRFHDLRGYAITEMLKEHGNVYQVGKIAGNSVKVIKKHYDRLKPEDLRTFRTNKRLLDEGE